MHSHFCAVLFRKKLLCLMMLLLLGAAAARPFSFYSLVFFYLLSILNHFQRRKRRRDRAHFETNRVHACIENMPSIVNMIRSTHTRSYRKEKKNKKRNVFTIEMIYPKCMGANVHTKI